MTQQSPEKKLVWLDRIQIIVASLLQIAILVLTIALLMSQQWFQAFVGAVVLGLTFVPAILERQLSVYLPVEFSLVTTVFLYASFALGEVNDFYARFWWWDLLLHSFSALMIGIVGFLMIYVFYMAHRIRIEPIYVAMVTLSLSVTVGTLWEIFEFLMDLILDLNMQKSGLVDTMTDIMVNLCGGMIAAISGYYYVRDGDSLLFDRLVRHFVRLNPRIFEAGENASSLTKSNDKY